MSAKLRLSAYAVLGILVLWFGWRFYAGFSKISAQGSDSGTNIVEVAKPPKPKKAEKTNNPAATATITTNSDQATNDLAVTNDVTASNGAPQVATPDLAQTNAVAADTNTVAGDTNAAASPAAEASPPAPAGKGGTPVGALFGLVLSLIGLGLLIAYDATQLIGSRATDLLFSDKGDLMRDPEYERAEAIWVDGRHLEAIEMMRDYLKKNPQEQYVALRIAEIYEKDLNNLVAASLEYEEILKKKLPSERWGWAAIHLCNIYSKMGKQEQVTALLQKIAKDYPKTSAAKKARRNLGLPEPEEAEAAPAEKEEVTDETVPGDEEVYDLDKVIATPDEAAAPEPQKPSSETPPETPPGAALPRGFRPKK